MVLSSARRITWENFSRDPWLVARGCGCAGWRQAPKHGIDHEVAAWAGGVDVVGKRLWLKAMGAENASFDRCHWNFEASRGFFDAELFKDAQNEDCAEVIR